MHVINSKHSLPLVILLCLAVVVGCTQPVATSSVELFSRGVTTTTKNTREGLVVVTGIERQAALLAEKEKLVGSDDFTLDPEVFITNDVLNSRFVALNALTEYGELLSALSGNQQGERVSGAIREAGQTLRTTLEGGLPLLPEEAVNPVVVEGGIDGLSELAEILVNAKINRSLPKVIDELNPSIKKIVTLLKADIGEDTNGDGRSDTGLRKILDIRVKEIAIGREVLLSRFREDKRVSTVELTSLYESAVSEVASVRATDRALVEVIRSLNEMQRAHEALITPNQPDTLIQVEQFLTIAERTTRLFPARI